MTLDEYMDLNRAARTRFLVEFRTRLTECLKVEFPGITVGELEVVATIAGIEAAVVMSEYGAECAKNIGRYLRENTK